MSNDEESRRGRPRRSSSGEAASTSQIPEPRNVPRSTTRRYADSYRRPIPKILENGRPSSAGQRPTAHSPTPLALRDLAQSPNIASIRERFESRATESALRVRSSSPQPGRIPEELKNRFLHNPDRIYSPDNTYNAQSLGTEQKQPWERSGSDNDEYHQWEESTHRPYQQLGPNADNAGSHNDELHERPWAEHPQDGLQDGEDRAGYSAMHSHDTETYARMSSEASQNRRYSHPNISTLEENGLTGSKSPHYTISQSPERPQQQPAAGDTALSSQTADPLPPHMSAFEYAIFPFLRAHPSYLTHMQPASPTDSDMSTGFPSPRAPPDPDEISVATEELRPLLPPRNPLPPHIDGRDNLDTRIKVIRIRTILLRCTVIARTAWELEHNPWKSRRNVYTVYSQIRKLAESALDIANELQSDGLRARCLYWQGRACGGQRFWDEAVPAFEQAINLDLGINTECESGLADSERADVKFLLRSAKARAEDDDQARRQRYKKDEESAELEAKKSGKPFEAVVEWTRSPPWHPDMEMIMQNWMAEANRTERKEVEMAERASGEGILRDGEEAEDSWHPNARQRWVLRSFTPEERYYIEHGDKKPSRLRMLGQDRGQRDGSNTSGLGSKPGFSNVRTIATQTVSDRTRRVGPPSINMSMARPIVQGVAVNRTPTLDTDIQMEPEEEGKLDVALDDGYTRYNELSDVTPRARVFNTRPRRAAKSSDGEHPAETPISPDSELDLPSMTTDASDSPSTSATSPTEPSTGWHTPPSEFHLTSAQTSPIDNMHFTMLEGLSDITKAHAETSIADADSHMEEVRGSKETEFLHG